MLSLMMWIWYLWHTVCILPDQQLAHKVNWCWADLIAGKSSSLKAHVTFTLMVVGVACEQGLGCTEGLVWIEVHGT